MSEVLTALCVSADPERKLESVASSASPTRNDRNRYSTELVRRQTLVRSTGQVLKNASAHDLRDRVGNLCLTWRLDIADQ